MIAVCGPSLRQVCWSRGAVRRSAVADLVNRQRSLLLSVVVTSVNLSLLSSLSDSISLSLIPSLSDSISLSLIPSLSDSISLSLIPSHSLTRSVYRLSRHSLTRSVCHFSHRSLTLDQFVTFSITLCDPNNLSLLHFYHYFSDHSPPVSLNLSLPASFSLTQCTCHFFRHSLSHRQPATSSAILSHIDSLSLLPPFSLT